MDAARDDFYAGLPVFHDFTQIADETNFRPLPDGWMVGVADVVQSTKAIQQNRYKAVNMAGAAVIVSITNALQGRDFPFVFGGDGASFAVAAADAARKVRLLAVSLLHFLIMRFRLRVGRFIPEKYERELIENSDFRKFDDSLRMVLDCTPELANEIEDYLKAAAADGIVRYGTHRQEAAMMTCFTPSPINPNHVHFIDGADGGYATAATAMKAS